MSLSLSGGETRKLKTERTWQCQDRFLQNLSRSATVFDSANDLSLQGLSDCPLSQVLEILAKQWGPLQCCLGAVNKKEFGAGARQDKDVASVWEGCRCVPQVEVVQVLTAAEVILIGDMDFPRSVKSF